jgi:hypothetical protein
VTGVPSLSWPHARDVGWPFRPPRRRSPIAHNTARAPTRARCVGRERAMQRQILIRRVGRRHIRRPGYESKPLTFRPRSPLCAARGQCPSLNVNRYRSAGMASKSSHLASRRGLFAAPGVTLPANRETAYVTAGNCQAGLRSLMRPRALKGRCPPRRSESAMSFRKCCGREK